MGSAYLLAHGIGHKCSDASTIIEIPENGDYRVWVRCKDWMPSAHPGTFEVFINDEPINHIFGQSGQDWSWELVEHVTLPKGKVKLSLHDLTGFDGRVDALYITNTTTTPIDYPLNASRNWRKRLLRLSKPKTH